MSKKGFIITLLGSIIFLSILILGVIWYSVSHTDYMKEAQKYEITTTEQLDNNISLKKVSLTSPVFNYQLTYPVVEDKKITEKLAEPILADKKAYFEQAVIDDNPNHLKLATEIKSTGILKNSYMISIVSTLTSDKETNQKYYSYIYTPDNKTVMSSLDIYSDPQQASQKIIEVLSNNTEISQKVSRTQFEKALKANKNLFSNYELSLNEENEDIITFHFATKDNVSGLTTLSTPLRPLVDFIKPEYRHSIVKNPNFWKRVALTFDDGPDATLTPKLLDILKQYHAKATFFEIGSHVVGNEAIIQRQIAEGHQVANHTWDHPALAGLNDSRVSEQVNSTTEALRKAGAKGVMTLRPPYGSVNEHVASIANMPIIMWSVDTEDWKNKNSKIILERVQAGTKNGAIILMHDIHKTSVDTVPAVIEWLQSEGYELVTVNELLGLQEGQGNGQQFFNAPEEQQTVTEE